MTQALAPSQPPARSVADLRARFLDVRDTTAVVVAAPTYGLFARHVRATERVFLYCLLAVGIVVACQRVAWLYTTARDWCADTYTTLRARRGRTQ